MVNHTKQHVGGRRIALVTETFAPEINGVANTLGYLCEGLAARNHQVTVIRPSLAGRTVPAGVGTTGDTPAPYEEITLPGAPLPGYPQLRVGLPAGRALRRLWQRSPPDTVYLATPGPLGWSAARVARRLGIPTVGGYHTHFQSYSRYYGIGFMERLIALYLRHFHNRCDATLVPTAGVKASIEALGIERVRLWSRGVDCDRFSPGQRSQALREEWGLSETDLAILYVGRLAAEKNLMQAVATFERLQGMHPQARFILVGDGPMGPRLQTRYPNFIFCGQRRGEDLARHFASGDILLFPSKTDTFGNVVIEGMASGLAVVAFDDGAAAEHIQDSANGMKVAFPKCNADRTKHDTKGNEAFTRAAMRLADQPSLRRRIAKGARDTALTLRWSLLTEQFENMILRPQTEVYAHADKQSLSTL